MKYGVDAPGVVRNLFLFSLLAFFLAALCNQWLLISYFLFCAFSLFASGCWMLYSMFITKPKIVSQLLDDLYLKGSETVLDLGCGRGLLLIAAAKRLPKGKAYGIDLWQTKDQSGNQREVTLRNAKTDGVEVEIQTGDIRSLPYPDEMFDAVVSSLVIHNIPDEAGREQALSELLRVLKPGGQFALLDIQYGKRYAEFLQATCLKTGFWYCPPICLVKGKKLRPR